MHSSLKYTPTSNRTLPLVGEQVSQAILSQFQAQGLKPEQLAFTFLDMTDPAQELEVNFRSEEPIYPASVVKMFYLVAMHQQLEDGVLQDSAELRRAERDMVIDSSNDATALIVDMLTGTTSGPELEPEPFQEWSYQRNAINRYFQALGYTGINTNQKTWNEGPYGVERQSVGADYSNRNRLTTHATARLMREIVTDQLVTPARCAAMRDVLERNPRADLGPDGGESQSLNYTNLAIRDIPGARLWSKAGWTERDRHDAAYVELPPSAERPQGLRFILVVFTREYANEIEIIPAVANAFLALDWQQLRAESTG